jgi:3-oxoacyl-[acyl-carrier-protein] synthase-3
MSDIDKRVVPGSNSHSTLLNANGNLNGKECRSEQPNPANSTKSSGPRKTHPNASDRRGVSNLRYAHIVGWGKEIPATIITNADLEAVIETNDEWIRSRTGIQARRFASDRETVTSMGFEASQQALDRAEMLPSELDLIIVATSTPEDFYPSTASQIQNLLGASHAGAFNLGAACSGFVYALNMAAQSIRSGSINNALVVGSEVNSRILDWSDRSTCVLFGDGAGAVVLRGSDEPGGILACVLGSDGSGAELLGIPTVGTAVLANGNKLHKLHMDGREVFRFGTHIISDSIREVLIKADLTLADLSLIVPHQANQRILAAAARNMNIPESMFYSNVHKYGNTSAASIPIALCEAEEDGRIKPNDRLILTGFGGGLSWATMVIQWDNIQLRAAPGLSSQLLRGRRQAEYVIAYWRDLIMRSYRRMESWIGGSPIKHANVRRNRNTSKNTVNPLMTEKTTHKPATTAIESKEIKPSKDKTDSV